MAMDLDQSCHEWSREGYSDQGDSADTLDSQSLDQGSISFGRFTIESLSWEKRSVFTHNRYQEELDKLRAPGLVAQKKAYFEEYYKRIRAIKSLQAKQQTELTSYCSDNCGISGQIVEEDAETALLESDSSANFSNDNKYSESSPTSMECQNVDINYNKNELMIKVIDDNEQHDLIRFGNKQEGVRLGSISGLIGEENHRIVKKGSHMVDEFESTIDSEPIAASIEDSKQLNFRSQDIEEILKKSEKNVPKDCVYHTSSPKILEFKLNKEQKTVNQVGKGYKGCAVTPEVTGHCSSPEDFINSEHRTKSGTVMLTQTSHNSSQKRNGQNCIISTNQTVDRILSSKYASLASHGLHKDSKVATPYSPLATVKPSISSTSASPRSNMNRLFSSPLPPTNISKGVSSRLGVLHSQKREKRESRREHEELGKKPLATDRKAAYLIGGSPSNMIRPLKARSVNLPNLRRGDTNVGINLDKLGRNNKVGKLKLEEMGHCSFPGDFIKSEHRTKSGTVMLTQASCDSSQKRNGDSSQKRNGQNCIILTNPTVDRILSSKYASVSSHGSHKDSKVTTPRSFLATVKPSISSTRASPRSNLNILFSSPLPPTNIISKGVSSRLGVPHSQKWEKLESRREHEKLGKTPLATDRKAAYLIGGNPSNMIRPLKARSVNLPTLRRGDTDVGINFDKLVRNNKVGKLKLVEMMAASPNRKKPSCCENSHNQRKLGQDKPRWR